MGRDVTGGEKRRGGVTGREGSRNGQGEEERKRKMRREICGDGQGGVETSEKRGEKTVKRRGGEMERDGSREGQSEEVRREVIEEMDGEGGREKLRE